MAKETPIQSLTMGIANSIQAGLKQAEPEVEIAFVLLMTVVGRDRIGVAANVDGAAIARVLRSALRGIYNEN